MAERHAEEYCKEVLGYGASNMRYVKGHIELLAEAGIADESVRRCWLNPESYTLISNLLPSQRWPGQTSSTPNNFLLVATIYRGLQYHSSDREIECSDTGNSSICNFRNGT